VPLALSVGGGASIAASFFLFLLAKKLPKKPPLSADVPSSEGLADLGGTVDAGKGFPVLGSTCTGRAAMARSLTIAIACGLSTLKYNWSNTTYPMAVQEIRVASVNIARFHRHQVFHQLIGRIHHFLEEVDNDHVNLLLELRVSLEERLVKELAKNADKFIVH